MRQENFPQSLRELTDKSEAPKKAVGYEYADTNIVGLKRDIPAELKELQAQKDARMEKLKADIALLDSKEGRAKLFESMPGMPVHYDKETNTYRVQLATGGEKKITKGELLTDSAWGITYTLHPDIPRNVVKEYLVHIARDEIAEKYDLQIIKHEGFRKTDVVETPEGTKILDHGRSSFERSAFQGIESQYKQKDKKMGFIAEKIVRNILMKLTIDHNLDFEIERVSFIEDFNTKIDSKIRFKKESITATTDRVRGVATEAVHDMNNEKKDTKRAFGIQFTINEDRIGHKLDQLKEVNEHGALENTDITDVILVTFSAEEIRDLHDEWLGKKVQCGGPDALMDRATIAFLVEKIFSGHATEEQMNEYMMAVYS